VLANRQVLGVRVDATSYSDAVDRILEWADHPQSRYVCVATVHTLMEAHDDRVFQGVVNGADLVTPDGMPLVWALWLLGVPEPTRVYGPDLTPLLCEAAARQGMPVGFYGGTPEVLKHMVEALQGQWPSLRVGYCWSPPFRPLTSQEEEEVVAAIKASGVRLLFIGLGCPKQERWMAAHRECLPLVMVGVGAAFDFLAGRKPQAPHLLQRAGLEWAFRLVTEPRRLWRRYLYHNPRYLGLFTWQLIRTRFPRKRKVPVQTVSGTGGGGPESGSVPVNRPVGP
jgi:N-acetylglucosaminyldiphosphoundecaprenol N-acetyl-beta-D-mannosaminyltransferase